MEDEFIERRIITGLIVSTNYVRETMKIWNPQFIESVTAKLLAGWCLDYFQTYQKAPGKDIEGIYNTHLQGGLDRKVAEDIEGIKSGL